MEALIKANALNQTGNVDYNKYGKLDGIGLKSYLTSLWIIFYFVYLYQITRNNFIGSQNRKIREMLNANRLEICIVKGISFFGSKNSKRRNARQHARSEQ